MKDMIKNHIDGLKSEREKCIAYKVELEGYSCEGTAAYQLNNLGISVIDLKIVFWSFFI